MPVPVFIERFNPVIAQSFAGGKPRRLARGQTDHALIIGSKPVVSVMVLESRPDPEAVGRGRQADSLEVSLGRPEDPPGDGSEPEVAATVAVDRGDIIVGQS